MLTGNQKFVFELDADVVKEANSVYKRLGFDIETAIRMFLNRTVDVKGIPFELSLNVTSLQGKPIRKNNKITEEMCENVWIEFLECVKKGQFEFSYASRKIESECGMSKGSAFIYLNFVKNLCIGQENSRNMKIEDLQFFLNKVRQDLDERAKNNAIDSLEKSLKYWKEKIPGGYAERAKVVLDNFRGTEGSSGKLTTEEILNGVQE